MGSDFDEIFAPKNRHSYVKALWASRGLIFGLTCVRCALVCTFVMEMDGFGQSELSSADTVDLRSVVPVL